MPKDVAQWELLKEADEIIKNIIIKYPELYQHIDPDIIGCAAIHNKPKPESQKWDAKIAGIREPEALWSKKIYCIQFYKTTWESYTAAQREWMLARMLERIPEEADGAVLSEDLRDSYRFVKKLGPDYMKDPNLPSLLESKQSFTLEKPEPLPEKPMKKNKEEDKETETI